MDNISRRQTNPEGNKLSPNEQTAIASELSKQYNEEENTYFSTSTSSSKSEQETAVKVVEKVEKTGYRLIDKEGNKLSLMVQPAITSKLAKQCKEGEKRNASTASKSEPETSVEIVEKVERTAFIDKENLEGNISASKSEQKTSVEKVEKTGMTLFDKIFRRKENLEGRQWEKQSKEEENRNFSTSTVASKLEQETSVEVVERVEKTGEETMKKETKQSKEEENRNFSTSTAASKLEQETSVEVVERVEKTGEETMKKETEEKFSVEEASKFNRNQRIREVFHMDVAEVIIEREQQKP